MTKVYEIAANRREAEGLAQEGFGYLKRKDAEEALASPEIDTFYRAKLKVFGVKTPEWPPE